MYSICGKSLRTAEMRIRFDKFPTDRHRTGRTRVKHRILTAYRQKGAVERAFRQFGSAQVQFAVLRRRRKNLVRDEQNLLVTKPRRVERNLDEADFPGMIVEVNVLYPPARLPIRQYYPNIFEFFQRPQHRWLDGASQ